MKKMVILFAVLMTAAIGVAGCGQEQEQEQPFERADTQKVDDTWRDQLDQTREEVTKIAPFACWDLAGRSRTEICAYELGPRICIVGQGFRESAPDCSLENTSANVEALRGH